MKIVDSEFTTFTKRLSWFASVVISVPIASPSASASTPASHPVRTARPARPASIKALEMAEEYERTPSLARPTWAPRSRYPRRSCAPAPVIA